MRFDRDAEALYRIEYKRLTRERGGLVGELLARAAPNTLRLALIYALLDRQAAQGGAVIVVSSDLEEIAALCQRCLIFDRGRVATELHGPELSVSNLLEHVGGAGVPADEGAALHV